MPEDDGGAACSLKFFQLGLYKLQDATWVLKHVDALPVHGVAYVGVDRDYFCGTVRALEWLAVKISQRDRVVAPIEQMLVLAGVSDELGPVADPRVHPGVVVGLGP